MIEENWTKINDKDKYSKEIKDKEENATTDYERSTCAENDDKLNKICEGKEMNYGRGGKDVDSVE